MFLVSLTECISRCRSEAVQCIAVVGNIARIANAVHCHSWLSGNKDCHEFRFSIVRIVISVSIFTSLQDCLLRHNTLNPIFRPTPQKGCILLPARCNADIGGFYFWGWGFWIFFFLHLGFSFVFWWWGFNPQRTKMKNFQIQTLGVKSPMSKKPHLPNSDV